MALLFFTSGSEFHHASLHRQQHRNFYIETTGDDHGNGRSIAQAWKSLDRLSREKLVPGDSVWLQSGAEFTGPLVLSKDSSGNDKESIEIASKGSPATILSPDADGITISAAGIHVRNLKIVGGAKKSDGGKIGVHLLANGSTRLKNVLVEKLEISGFGADGLSIEAAKQNPNGFEGLRVLFVNSHDNFGAGIASSDDFASKGLEGAHRNVLISDCQARHNLSGSGFVLSGIRGGLVQYCRSDNNLGHGGGVGIWAWAAQNLTFRYCISEGTRSGGGDGGGFDLDGGTEDCVVERCLSYDNDGPGYMHCDYPTAPFTRRNVMKDSVSINDGRKQKGDSVGFGFVSWGSGLDDCTISGNLTLISKPDHEKRDFGALFVAFIKGSQGPKDVLHVLGCKFVGNVTEVDADGVAFVRNDLANPNPKEVTFTDNLFRSDAPAPFIQGDKPSATLTFEDWKRQPGSDVNNRQGKLLRTGSVETDFGKVDPRQLPAFLKRARQIEES